MPEITRCARCSASEGGRVANPARLRRYRIDRGREANLCDPCRDLTEQHHTICEVEAGKGRSQSKRPKRSKQSKPVGSWVHRGGGHYENTETGERRRGRP